MPTCIFGCAYKPGMIFHRFPNPKISPERLQEWRNIARDFTKGLDDQSLYLRVRICHRHFDSKYWNRNNRLNRMAMPTLFLPNSRKIFKKPAKIEKPIEEVSLSKENNLIPRGEDDYCTGNTSVVDKKNTLEENLPETADDTSDQVFSPDIDSFRRNSVALKYASVQMSLVDIHICGECHSVFHFIQQFKEHRDGVACSGISPYRDAKESISNTWAFLLWKSSTSVAHVGEDENLQLMKRWNELPEKTRDAWITAGKQVLELSKYADIELAEVKQDHEDDLVVPVQRRTEPAKKYVRPDESAIQTRSKGAVLENNPERHIQDPMLQELKSDNVEDSCSRGSVESEKDPLSIESNPRIPKWCSVQVERSTIPLKIRHNSVRLRQLQEAALCMKPCVVVLQDIAKQLHGSKMPLKVKPLGQLMAAYFHKNINAECKKSQQPRCSTKGQDGIKTLQRSKVLSNRALQSARSTRLKFRQISTRAQPFTLQPPIGPTETRFAEICSAKRTSQVPLPRPRILKSSKTHVVKKQTDVQSSTTANLDNELLNSELINQPEAESSKNMEMAASEPKAREMRQGNINSASLVVKPAAFYSKHTGGEKSHEAISKTRKECQLGKVALRIARNRPWRANYKIKETKPVPLWKLPSGVIMKGANPPMKTMKLVLNDLTKMNAAHSETKCKKVYYVMKKDKSDENQQLGKATLFVHKYNELWKKSPVTAALDEETISGNTKVKSASSPSSQANEIDDSRVQILGTAGSVAEPETSQGNRLTDQEANEIDDSRVQILGTAGSVAEPETSQGNRLTDQEANEIDDSRVQILGTAGSVAEPETSQGNRLTDQEEKQPAVATETNHIPMDTINDETTVTPSGASSSETQSEHAYSKCPPSDGPIVRKPVVRTRVFPIPPIVNNGIIITSWGVNNHYLEQTTVETPITSTFLTTDATKPRKKKSTSKDLMDQFFRNLGPMPPPSPEPDLTLCPLTGELLAPAGGSNGQADTEEMIDGSALDEEHDNISLASMPMLLEEDLSFNE